MHINSCYFYYGPSLLILCLSYPLWQLQFYPCSSTKIPGSINYHFIFSSLIITPKNITSSLGALIRPYSFMYCTLSRDGALQQVEAFDGVKDPVDHLNTYKNQMELHGYQDPVRCQAFAITLKGPALAWFNRLPPSSISSFRELSIVFVSHFIGARTYRKPSYHLLTIKQGSEESLRSYVQRFNAESLKVDIPDEKFVITAFIAGLGVQSKDLMFSISKNPQASMDEVLAKAEKYINSEEALISKKESSSSHKEKSGTDKRRGRSPKRQSDRERTPMKDGERSPKRRGNLKDRLGPSQFEIRRRYSPQRFTPLNASISQVLRKVRNEQFLRWPTQMKLDTTIRDNTKYCKFHSDYGNRTDG